jgi:hypothetical protein
VAIVKFVPALLVIAMLGFVASPEAQSASLRKASVYRSSSGAVTLSTSATTATRGLVSGRTRCGRLGTSYAVRVRRGRVSGPSRRRFRITGRVTSGTRVTLVFRRNGCRSTVGLRLFSGDL